LIDHKCGAVQDFCTFRDTKIYFCIFCKKVISAKVDQPQPQPEQVEITYSVTVDLSDKKQNEYDEANLAKWV